MTGASGTVTELGSIEADLGLGEERADAIVLSGDGAGVVIGDSVSPDIVKRSIVVAGHKTSVSLEDAFWLALKDIARERGQSLRSLVAEIDAGRKGGNLSSAVRLHVLDHYRRRAGAIGAVRG